MNIIRHPAYYYLVADKQHRPYRSVDIPSVLSAGYILVNPETNRVYYQDNSTFAHPILKDECWKLPIIALKTGDITYV